MRLVSIGRFFINRLRNAGFLVLLLVFVNSCKESEIYPDIPSIEFKGYDFIIDDITSDTIIKVYIGFKDGDGDIGLEAGDTFPPFNLVLDSFRVNHNPYYDNIHADYMEMRNGKWVPLINPANKDTVRLSARIQNITPEGKYKAIRGTIEWENFLSLFNDRADTIMLKIWIYDRALHKSNILETPTIVVP